MNVTETWVLFLSVITFLSWVLYSVSRIKLRQKNGRDQLARDSPWLSNMERREFDGITREQ